MKEIQRAPNYNAGINWQYGGALGGYAVLCLAAGDTKGYRTTVAQIVAQLERRVEGHNAVLCWVCTLAPDTVTNYGLLLEVVTNAVARQANITNSLYDRETLGALLHRAGRYPEAARQLADMYELDQRVKPNPKTTAATQSAYLLALTHAQLGHTNEASEWFERASDLDPFAGGTRGPAAAKVYWWNQLALQWLRKEADSVLNARASPPTSPP